MRMLARTWYVHATNFMPATLYDFFNVAHDMFNVVLVKPVFRDKNIQLIEIRFFAQLDQGGEIDITVNDVLHPRLRLAHVVNAAGNCERLLNAIGSLYDHRIANARFRDLKRVALDQDLARCRRPRAFLRNKLADADVAVIVNDKQDYVAPLHWSRLELTTYCPTRFGITHFRVLQNGLDQIVVDRVDAYHRRRWVSGQITLVQFTREDCVRRKHRGERGDAERDSKHNEHCSCAFVPKIANSLTPECVHSRTIHRFHRLCETICVICGWILPSEISTRRSITRAISAS